MEPWKQCTDVVAAGSFLRNSETGLCQQPRRWDRRFDDCDVPHTERLRKARFTWGHYRVLLFVIQGVAFFILAQGMEASKRYKEGPANQLVGGCSSVIKIVQPQLVQRQTQFPEL